MGLDHVFLPTNLSCYRSSILTAILIIFSNDSGLSITTNGGDGFQRSGHEDIALNNEMHKTLIGFYIPATYIAYYTMFHGMNNQLKALRSKDWTTTTTVARVTKSSTTVDFITNDEMDWEPTVTSSSTKTVKQKAKWVSPAIITKRKEKRACFRCAIVGHKVNKYPFLPARRPVVAAATMTTTIPKTIIEKVDSEKK